MKMDDGLQYDKIKVGRAEDLTGQTFGHWKVLYRTNNNASNKAQWVCQCDCEKKTIKPVDAKSLKSYTSTNCGCERNKTISIKNDLKIHQKDEEGNIILKRCYRCKKWLTLDNFWKSSSQKDGYSGECKNCSSHSKENRYNIYKKNAKKRGLNFNITKEEFYYLTSQECYYCGDLNEYNGIDRINSDLDYSMENCVPCCEYCNKMKLNYSIDFWLNHMRKILNYYGG